MGDVLDTLEAVDGFAHVRNALRRLSVERGEWAGYPLPIDGSPLVVEPTFYRAKELMEIGREKAPDPDEHFTIRNTFFSWRRRCRVTIWEQNGKIGWGLEPAFNHIPHAFNTLAAADAWGIEQEHNAVQLLGTMLRHRNFKQYLLTGMFLERSEHSGVVYMFRRLRPTLAIRADEKGSRILAALCLHPIAYYEGSWAGAMTPSDDIISHLVLMRGDEHLFWRRANQHPPHAPEAGI